jgi:Holliday junction DNA helicase RuvA
MIYFIKGKVEFKLNNFAVINVNGIGFKIFLSEKNLKEIKIEENILLFTYFHYRENSIELYGFLNQFELEFFELLNSVSGIGPKTALSILNKNTIPELASAIKNNKVDFLTSSSGIGKKTAEKIILELKNKVKLEKESEISSEIIEINKNILDALIDLGYKKEDAKKALSQVDPNILDLKERLKAVFKILNKK